MRKTIEAVRLLFIAVSLAGIATLSSCQQFFTTSLASSLARDSYTIPANMTVADASALLDEALLNGDAEMAAQLVTPLLAALEAETPGTEKYNEAAAALLDAVVLSSGVGAAMTNMATTLASADLDNLTEEDLAGAMASLSTIALSNDAEAALLLLAANPPADMSADDAYSAAIALAADSFTDAGLSIDTIDTLSEDQITEFSEDASMAAAVDLIGQAQDLGGDESLFGDLLSGVDLSQFGL
jgi:hypothetical protein